MVFLMRRLEQDSKQRKLYEEYAYILDIYPSDAYRGTPPVAKNEEVLQLIGEDFFTLLEAAAWKGKFSTGMRVYVGRNISKQVLRILRRISYNELTLNAKSELEQTIQKIIISKENKFVEFFNKANPLTPRLHSLELLPTIGKKSLRKILDEREREEFKSFEDIKTRANISDPIKLITKRVIEELSNPMEKYHIFLIS